MGLLDPTEDPRTMGLLSLGMGLLGARGSFGQALSQAGPQALQAMQMVKDRRMAMEDRQQQQKARDLQMQQAQIQLAEAQRAQAEREQLAALARQYSRSPQQQALANGQGPTVANAAAISSTAPGFDFGGYANALAGIDPVKALSIQQAMRKEQPKLAKLEQMRDPQGRMVNVAVFEDGTSKVLPYGVKPEIALQNLGNRVVAIDKNSTTNGASFNIGTSPDAVYQGGITMRGQNMADARARESTAATLVSAGKPPAGYRFTADGQRLEAIPGGPADIKAGEMGAKAEAKKAAQLAASTNVRGTINEAIGLVGNSTAGVGSWLQVLPATDARNLAAKLETVKANLGFDRLQEMRDQSPTGGALGAVAVQELTALQSTVASLDQAQSPAQLRAALKKIDGHYGRWQRVMRGELPTSGATGGWGDGAQKPARSGADLFKAADAILGIN